MGNMKPLPDFRTTDDGTPVVIKSRIIEWLRNPLGMTRFWLIVLLAGNRQVRINGEVLIDDDSRMDDGWVYRVNFARADPSYSWGKSYEPHYTLVECTARPESPDELH